MDFFDVVSTQRRIVPVARRCVAGRVEEGAVLHARDGIDRRLERVDVDAVDRPLVFLAVFAAHHEGAGGDAFKPHRGNARTS